MYHHWSQIAAHFDGDGCISVRKLSHGIPFTLGVSLEFVDQSRKQIEMVRYFLEARHVQSGAVALRGGAWRISVGSLKMVAVALQKMLPHLCKKHDEVKAALEYLQSKITGNEFQSRLEKQVREGNREKFGKRIDLPWTRREGLRLANKFATSFAGRKGTLTVDRERRLVQKYAVGGISQRRLAIEVGLSHDVVRRALARHGLATER